MLFTGAGTILGAPFGGHAINLAALSAAPAAGEEAGEDRSRRWVAAFTTGLAYLVLAVFSAALATVVIAASGLGFAGIGAAFWALAAGLLVRWVLSNRAS